MCAAVPDVTFPASAVAPDGRVLPGRDGKPSYGHAWRSAALTPFVLTRGRAPHDAGDLVVDHELATRAQLAPGDKITVQSTGAPRSYRVTGIAAPRDGDHRQQTSLFFTTAEAGRLAAHPRQVAAVGVLPEPGVSTARRSADIAEALSGTKVRVHTGGDRGPAEFLDAAAARTKLISMGGAIGGTALLVAILVVVGTFALSIQQRQRELALLRAIAATPRQIRRLLGREALVVGRWRVCWGRSRGCRSPPGCTAGSSTSERSLPPCIPRSAFCRCSPRSPRPCSEPGPRCGYPPAGSIAFGRWKRCPRPPPNRSAGWRRWLAGLLVLAAGAVGPRASPGCTPSRPRLR